MMFNKKHAYIIKGIDVCNWNAYAIYMCKAISQHNSGRSYSEAPLEFIEKYYQDDLAERNISESKWALDWLGYVIGDSILCLGCGPNFYDDVQFFQNTPKEFVGIDINKNNITFLKDSQHPEVLRWKRFLKSNNVRVELVVGNILDEQKNFIDRFDCIYAIGVLGMFEIEKTHRLFGLLNKYLKKKGIIVDIDWTEPYLTIEQLKEREYYRWFSVRGPKMEKIGSIMESEGFKIQKFASYKVINPQEYSWGRIYSYVVSKVK